MQKLGELITQFVTNTSPISQIQNVSVVTQKARPTFFIPLVFNVGKVGQKVVTIYNKPLFFLKSSYLQALICR